MIHCPADDTHRSSNVGVPDSDHATHAGIECRTTVKSEPPEPDENGAEEDNGDVVRFVDVLLLVAATITEDESIGQTSRAGGDVDWATASEVESTLQID